MMTTSTFNIDSEGKAFALGRALWLARRRYDKLGIVQVIWENGCTFMYRDVGDAPSIRERAEGGWRAFIEVYDDEY